MGCPETFRLVEAVTHLIDRGRIGSKRLAGCVVGELDDLGGFGSQFTW